MRFGNHIYQTRRNRCGSETTSTRQGETDAVRKPHLPDKEKPMRFGNRIYQTGDRGGYSISNLHRQYGYSRGDATIPFLTGFM